MSQETRFTVLQQIQRAAHQLAPAIREMFDRAGLAPADLKTVDDLSRLPVFKKESLVELQRQRPPFGVSLQQRMKKSSVSSSLPAPSTNLN